MIPTYRVSNLAAYSRWKNEENDGIGWLYNSIFASETTEAMSRGTAFHHALEKVMEREHLTVEADGYTFAFTCDAEIVLPKTRELRVAKDYGGIIITGQCDGVEGRSIIDHKTVQQFDAEYHLDGWQHRLYLDLFEADRFDWHIWEVAEIKDRRTSEEMEDRGTPTTKPYEVYAHHLLTQYRYVGLEEDCTELAHEFRDFAARMGWNGIGKIAA